MDLDVSRNSFFTKQKMILRDVHLTHVAWKCQPRDLNLVHVHVELRLHKNKAMCELPHTDQTWIPNRGSNRWVSVVRRLNYTFSIKRQKDEKCLFSPTEFKTMLRHQFLLNFVHLNVGNSWKTYKTKLFDHLLLLNRIVGAKITATECCLFFFWKRQKHGARQYRTLWWLQRSD